VEDHRVKTQTVQEGEREGQVVQLVGKDCASDPGLISSVSLRNIRLSSLENGKLGFGQDSRVGRFGRSGEDPEVSLDFMSRAQRVEESDDGVLAFISCELDWLDQVLTLSIPPSRPEETAALSPLFLISCPTFLASSSKTTFELDSCEEGAGKDGLVKALVERATGRERGRVERRRSIVGG
jgi:hypothetical protein